MLCCQNLCKPSWMWLYEDRICYCFLMHLIRKYSTLCAQHLVYKLTWVLNLTVGIQSQSSVRFSFISPWHTLQHSWYQGPGSFNAVTMFRRFLGSWVLTGFLGRHSHPRLRIQRLCCFDSCFGSRVIWRHCSPTLQSFLSGFPFHWQPPLSNAWAPSLFYFGGHSFLMLSEYLSGIFASPDLTLSLW